MTTHEVLVAARNLLDRSRWVQGAAWSEGRFCAYGALARIRDLDKDAGRSAIRFVAALIGASPNSVNAAVGIGQWNDVPGRTKEQVLALFDRAIVATAPPPEDLDLSLPAHLDGSPEAVAIP